MALRVGTATRDITPSPASCNTADGPLFFILHFISCVKGWCYISVIWTTDRERESENWIWFMVRRRCWYTTNITKSLVCIASCRLQSCEKKPFAYKQNHPKNVLGCLGLQFSQKTSQPDPDIDIKCENHTLSPFSPSLIHSHGLWVLCKVMVSLSTKSWVIPYNYVEASFSSSGIQLTLVIATASGNAYIHNISPSLEYLPSVCLLTLERMGQIEPSTSLFMCENKSAIALCVTHCGTSSGRRQDRKREGERKEKKQQPNKQPLVLTDAGWTSGNRP